MDDTYLFVLTLLVVTIFVSSIGLNTVHTQSFKFVGIKIVERSGNDLYAYPIQVIIPADKIDMSLVAPDCSNLYVVNASGEPLYYFVTVCTKSFIAMWIKIPFLKAYGETYIYVIYGGPNPYASYNDPKKVFTFFDDFHSLEAYWLHTGSESMHSIVNNDLLFFTNAKNDTLYTMVSPTGVPFFARPLYASSIRFSISKLYSWRVITCGIDEILNSDGDLGIAIASDDPLQSSVLRVTLNLDLNLTIAMSSNIVTPYTAKVYSSIAISRAPDKVYCFDVRKYKDKLIAIVYSDKGYRVEVRNSDFENLELLYLGIGVVSISPDTIAYDFIAVMPYVDPPPSYSFVSVPSIGGTVTVTKTISNTITKTVISTKTVTKTNTKTLTVTKPITMYRTKTTTSIKVLYRTKTERITRYLTSTTTRTSYLTKVLLKPITTTRTMYVPTSIYKTVTTSYRYTETKTKYVTETEKVVLHHYVTKTIAKPTTLTSISMKLVSIPVTVSKIHTLYRTITETKEGLNPQSLALGFAPGIGLGIAVALLLTRRRPSPTPQPAVSPPVSPPPSPPQIAMQRPVELSRCPFCGKELPRDTEVTFCPFCGAYLRQDETNVYGGEPR